MTEQVANSAVLQAILEELKQLKVSQATLEGKIEAITATASPGSFPIALPTPHTHASIISSPPLLPTLDGSTALVSQGRRSSKGSTNQESKARLVEYLKSHAVEPKPKEIYPQRVILTTYPTQSGIEPIPLKWGNKDPQARGPVIASRHGSTIKVRNAVGAYNGSYAVYKALATAVGQLSAEHRPDFTNTEPPFDIPYQESWTGSNIVSMDPWGHLSPQVFKSYLDKGIDLRPTIAVTKAHLKVLEIDEAVKAGRLQIDGKVVTRSSGSVTSMATADKDHGVEVAVSKAAVEPVWWLPGIAERFKVPETLLRRALFEDGGGQYPELLTRPDLEVFLPPIGGLTAYIFGPPEYLSDPTKELTVRVHDECNGSDVFGSDICTCRPYLLYGIEEAVKCAQRGGVGLVVYFRKEGRALGEVTKYLVYNARKRGSDTASMYFRRTEDIAGVKDMRFQALMPDVLLWLGVKKIDHMISMSDMKHDAIVSAGIPILERHEIPEDLLPPDAQVEIDAKIAHGYFSNKKVTLADLDNTVGRGWEETDKVVTVKANWEDVQH